MIPTPAFKVALKEVENAALYLEEAETELTHGTEQAAWRRIVITSVPFICDKLLSPSMHKLPAIRRLRIEVSGRDTNLELIGNREADIALRLGPKRNKSITATHIADIDYSTFISQRVETKTLPWVTIDHSHSHLKEVRLPEEHSGGEGIRFTATSTSAIQNIIVTGAAKGMLPNFVGTQNSELKKLADHPTTTRPLWVMWREGALELPHFQSTINWILQITGEKLVLTDDAHSLASKLSLGRERVPI